MIYDVAIDGKNYRLDLERAKDGWSCRVDGHNIEVDAVWVRPGALSLRIGNKSYDVKCEALTGATRVWVGPDVFEVEVRDPRSLRGRSRTGDEKGAKKLTAPMPGKVVRILAAEGAEVQAGAAVIVVEAMKMQNEIKSPKTGKVLKLLVSQGSAVNAGDVLAIVE